MPAGEQRNNGLPDDLPLPDHHLADLFLDTAGRLDEGGDVLFLDGPAGYSVGAQIHSSSSEK
jgi:hypothetical protein